MEMVEPYGDRRLDHLFAMLFSQIANIIRDDKKHPEPFSYRDFLIDWEKVWKSVVDTNSPETEDDMSEEELESLNVALRSKVLNAHTWFGGVGE